LINSKQFDTHSLVCETAENDSAGENAKHVGGLGDGGHPPVVTHHVPLKYVQSKIKTKNSLLSKEIVKLLA
jgi:hypothetical protein